MEKFIPVPAKTKGFSTNQKERVERFPNESVLSTSEIKEKTSKTISLSKQAVEALGLTEGNSSVAIQRGYVDNETKEEGLFIYATQEENVQFINFKNHSVKMKPCKITWSTKRGMSAMIHGAISTFFNYEGTEERHYKLTLGLEDKYFCLQPYNVESNNENTPGEDVINETENTPVGEIAEVTVD